MEPTRTFSVIIYFYVDAMSKDKKTYFDFKNKKAKFEYHILDTYVAGVMLHSTEIKSLRAGKAQINEGYCRFINDELWAMNINIATYSFGTYNNHKEKRDRKLLLNKNELRKLQKSVKERGHTIVPLRLFENERGYAKMEIALVKGKKIHDKRQSLKEKDEKREMERLKKRNF